MVKWMMNQYCLLFSKVMVSFLNWLFSSFSLFNYSIKSPPYPCWDCDNWLRRYLFSSIKALTFEPCWLAPIFREERSVAFSVSSSFTCLIRSLFFLISSFNLDLSSKFYWLIILSWWLRLRSSSLPWGRHSNWLVTTISLESILLCPGVRFLC